MNIIPYEYIDHLKFGSDPNELLIHFGKPQDLYFEQANERVIQYEYFYFLFDCDELQEICIHSGYSFSLNGIMYDWEIKTFHQCIEKDGNPLESSGSVILFNMGMVFHDYCNETNEKSIVFFRKGAYDKIQENRIPYDYKRHYLEWLQYNQNRTP